MSFSLGFITYAVSSGVKSYLAMAWGRNLEGNIGDNSTTAKSSPVSVVGSHSFISIVGSIGLGTHCLALKADGSAWSWGLGTSGQLGDNSITSKSSPVSVVGGNSFIEIACSESASYALKADGSAWSWGSGLVGQLGDNSTTGKSSPISVVGGHSFIKIAGGVDYCVALKADGSAWAWGEGVGGRLGNNSTLDRSSPVSVVGGHSFIQIAAYETTYALKADGSAWAWGSGSRGRLGDNTVTSKSSPVAVVGGHSFVKISGGSYNGYALKADGSAWGWGYANGVGDNQNLVDRSSPVSVVGGHSFILIKGNGEVGKVSTVTALKSDGSAWSWGVDANGALGAGTTANTSSPVSVVGGYSFTAVSGGATGYALK